MKSAISLQLSQRLALSPQLQQSIRLLQLSTTELSQKIEQVLSENPFLERDDEILVDHSHAPETETSSSENHFQEHPSEPIQTPDDSHNEGSEGGAEIIFNRTGTSKDWADAIDFASDTSALTLSEHLKRQAALLHLSDLEHAALYFLIGSLNDDGYLEDSLEELALSLEDSADETTQQALIQQFQIALGGLQSFDPIGVGARNLNECLQLQICADAEHPLAATALKICQHPLELLARRNLRKLSLLCHISEENIRAALPYIARLEPKPGRRFAHTAYSCVIPDVIVSLVAHTPSLQLQVRINPEILPGLRICDEYAHALRKDKSDHAKLHQHLQEARWFVKSLQQRFDTLLRVTNAIVERQKNFFIHGEQAMQPMLLRELADELELHQSTISRATTAKYMASTQGVFELKYFFASRLGTNATRANSNVAVRAHIKQLIALENPGKPLSDNQLSAMLKEEGINCARRTVTKYREALKLAPSSLRKKFDVR